MAKEFIYYKPSGEPTEPVCVEDVLAAARSRVKVGDGPFVLTQDGEPFRPEDRKAVLERLERRLRNGKPGPTYRIRDLEGDVVFKAREVVAPPVIDTNGNDKADKFWTWVVTEFKDYHPRFAGAYVCKHIAGSSSMSQHSYGNAVDVFFDTMAHQVRVYEAIKAGKAPVPIGHAISGKLIWSPASGQHAYGGDTHYHLHVDFVPDYSGPCGVRP